MIVTETAPDALIDVAAQSAAERIRVSLALQQTLGAFLSPSQIAAATEAVVAVIAERQER